MDETEARASVSGRVLVADAVAACEVARDNPVVGPTAYGLLTDARSLLLSALAFPLDAEDQDVSLEEFAALCEGSRTVRRCRHCGVTADTSAEPICNRDGLVGSHSYADVAL